MVRREGIYVVHIHVYIVLVINFGDWDKIRQWKYLRVLVRFLWKELACKQLWGLARTKPVK